MKSFRTAKIAHGRQGALTVSPQNVIEDKHYCNLKRVCYLSPGIYSAVKKQAGIQLHKLHHLRLIMSSAAVVFQGVNICNPPHSSPKVPIIDGKTFGVPLGRTQKSLIADNKCRQSSNPGDSNFR